MLRKLLFGVVLCGGAYMAYHDWTFRREVNAYKDSHPLAYTQRPPSPAGFVDTVIPDGLNPNVMTVFTPPNCPLEAGIRGRALIAKMKDAHIPVAVASEARVSAQADSAAALQAKLELIRQSATVLSGETPIVFYKGRGKNNPSFEDVQLEFQSGR